MMELLERGERNGHYRPGGHPRNELVHRFHQRVVTLKGGQIITSRMFLTDKKTRRRRRGEEALV